MIFTSISPNTERDDIALAFRTLWMPWMWKRGSYSKKLEALFNERFSGFHAYAFQSGRNSLYALLQTLNLKSDDEVLIQAYTCVAVPEPILWVNAKPIYVDVLNDFTMDPADLRKKISPNSKVLIIQHTFGTPAHMDELLAIAREHNLFIIEDCAHALGAEYKGKKVGTFGDAAFFSFGRDKVLSSVFGGILIIKDINKKVLLENIQKDFHYPSYFSIARNLKHPIIMSVVKKTYTLFSLGKIITHMGLKIGFIPKAVEPIERQGGKPSFFGEKMSNAMARLALHQMSKLEKYNTHRSTIAEIYTKELKIELKDKNILSDVKPIYLRYTILVSNPQEVMKEAKKKGIELGDWYQQSIAPRNVHYTNIHYRPETCPRAESLAVQSLNLPTHIGITDHDARYIANVVNTYAR